MVDRMFFPEPEDEEVPNKFTIFMGKRIKEARESQGYSQQELAKHAYMRQASISDIENGRREVTTYKLTLIAEFLNRPLLYFFAPFSLQYIVPEPLNPDEQELLIQSRRLNKEDLRRLLVQIGALANSSEKDRINANRSTRSQRMKKK
jgi:transcriptional regulator with XRE-family HTH domain